MGEHHRERGGAEELRDGGEAAPDGAMLDGFGEMAAVSEEDLNGKRSDNGTAFRPHDQGNGPLLMQTALPRSPLALLASARIYAVATGRGSRIACPPSALPAAAFQIAARVALPDAGRPSR
jgi:hypothetical protein